MFGFLRKKLGEVISKFSEKAKEGEKKEGLKEEKPPAAKSEPEPEPLLAAAKAKEKREIKEELKETQIVHSTIGPIRKSGNSPIAQSADADLRPKANWEKEAKEEIREEPKKGFFERITSAVTEAVTTTKISGARFEELFQDLEITLLENNVAVEAVDKIKAYLKGSLVEKPLQRGKVEEVIRKTLRSSIEELFISGYDFKEKIVEAAAGKKPAKIMFVGING